jgi:hypothetical protein
MRSLNPVLAPYTVSELVEALSRTDDAQIRAELIRELKARSSADLVRYIVKSLAFNSSHE